MLENIIYVVGSPRSGSSLIYNALCSHEKFNPAIPENHLVTNLTKDCLGTMDPIESTPAVCVLQQYTAQDDTNNNTPKASIEWCFLSVFNTFFIC